MKERNTEQMIDKVKLIKMFNPVNGCNIGCPYCYARKINQRFHIIPDFNVPTFQEQRLQQLYKKKGEVYLITSMSDFSGWKPAWREKIFKVLTENPQHSYTLLTKRPELIHFETNLDNVWIGVSVTNKNDVKRIETLKQNIKCKHYCVTFEPLHVHRGDLDLSDIEWIFIGAEIGNRKGKIKPEKEWVMNIVKQAKEFNIPVCMKMSLLDVVGKENWTQDFPEQYNNIIFNR